MIYTSGTDTNDCPQGAFSGRYGLTGGVAWRASPCGDTLLKRIERSVQSIINAEIPSEVTYRIGPGTYVPLMFDPTGGGAWCTALCGMPADEGSADFSRSVAKGVSF